MVAAEALKAYDSVEEAFNVIGQNDQVNVYLPQEEYALQYKKGREQMNRLYKKVWGGAFKDGNYEFRV